MTPEIKQRIEQIRRGNVPEGYQKTKDGIFPTDWHTQKMKQWVALAERPVTLEDDKRYRLVTVRRGFGGVDLRGEYLGKDILVKNYFRARQGDFLISKRQIAHGACGVVPESLDGAVVSNEYNVFVPNQGTNIEMFNLMMQLPHYTRLFYLMSDGVHIEKLLFKTQDWMRRQLAMPPIEEQRKIAAILATQDEVIELKEKQLTGKQRQKKYLMQQLLTGKKRLPGFAFEVEKTNIKAISTYSVSTISQTMLESYEGKQLYPVFNANSIAGHVDFYENECPYISIIKDGAGIGRVRLCEAKSSTIGTMGCIHARKGISIIFLYYLLEQVDFNKYSNGSTIPHLYYKDYSCEKVRIPDIKEQAAIAEVLSTADREIELLQQDIEQEKQKKKALMQLLLMGIVRVKI